MVKSQRVVQPCAINRGRSPIVLRGAKDSNRVGRRRLVLPRVRLNLPIDPPAPPASANHPKKHQKQYRTKYPARTTSSGLSPGLSLARLCPALPFFPRGGPLHAHLLLLKTKRGFLSLQDHHDLMRRNGALAQDLPASRPKRQVNNRGGQ